MDLDKIKNIRGTDIESELKESIGITRSLLSGLDEHRMCRIYTSLLKSVLYKKHIVSRIVDTDDLGFNYGHQFLMVPSGNEKLPYYLVDLTFSQFQILNDDFYKLLIDGYQLVDDKYFSKYLSYIDQSKNDIELDQIFYQIKK